MNSQHQKRDKILTEPQLAASTPVSLRLAEADYFLSEFKVHCGPPADSYFLMIACADAFLALVTSVEDLVSDSDRGRLWRLPAFRFLKTLRNITIHHGILAAPGRGKFRRPFRRIIREGVGGRENPTSSTLLPQTHLLLDIFEALLEERPEQRKNIDGAIAFLDSMLQDGEERPLEDLFTTALSATASVLEGDSNTGEAV